MQQVAVNAWTLQQLLKVILSPASVFFFYVPIETGSWLLQKTDTGDSFQ